MNFLLRNILTSNYPIKVLRRQCHTHNEKKVRVRFAPSPTGFLHLGGLRTALYNYLFAKSKNGKFIVRIEDTDQARIVPGATEKLIQDLQWSGIQIDEGPGIGGEYGPYIQSKRVQIYRNEVKKLLENGSAYYCFCSERRLDLLRKEAVRTRQVPKYDNKCRHLTPVEIAKKITKDETFCIRFKLSSYRDHFDDIVYGKVMYDVSENEGDPVIIKSDGFPTYHFASVVDDHIMEITHVLRGIEWQISTTKHLLMYRAFQWEPPQFGHLPLLVNADGTKLSKRQGDIQIKQYRDNGYFPLSLVNYVTQAGGGFVREQSVKPKLYTIGELVNEFNISKINSSPGKLNPDLLPELNRLEILRRLQDESLCEQLVDDVKSIVLQNYPKDVEKLDLESEHIKSILQWATTRVTTVKDLVDGNLSFLWILPPLLIYSDLSKDTVDDLILKLKDVEFNKDDIQILLKDFAKEKNLKFANFMKILRSALSGLKEGPGVAEMMEILGKNATMHRISNIQTK